MTNKIKPFCVNVQDIDGKGTVATEQQIRDLHKMCIEAGVVEYDTEDMFVSQMLQYPCKGVSRDGDTFSHEDRWVNEYFNNTLIHLNQVPSHLGLDLPKEDNTLVEGTLDHAYVTLKGDLNNCKNSFGNYIKENMKTLWFNTSTKEFYVSLTEKAQRSENTDKNMEGVCTIEEFQAYCEEQRSNSSVNNPLSDDNSPEDESPIESVKPLKWTVCAQKQGVPLQVGMTCVDKEGIELEVKYLGDKLAIVIEVEDDRECSATVDSLLPFPKELSPEEEQREKVMTYLLTEFDEEDSEIIYDNLLKLGVFKF